MRVFVDSNILISAALFPAGQVAARDVALIESGHEIVTSDYVLDQLRRVATLKFPAHTDAVETFIAIFQGNGLVLPTPAEGGCDEARIRDEKDRPVFRAARAASADVLLTGDKDLLDAGLVDPDVLPATGPGGVSPRWVAETTARPTAQGPRDAVPASSISSEAM